jgi:hypothetical protein
LVLVSEVEDNGQVSVGIHKKEGVMSLRPEDKLKRRQLNDFTVLGGLAWVVFVVNALNPTWRATV